MGARAIGAGGPACQEAWAGGHAWTGRGGRRDRDGRGLGRQGAGERRPPQPNPGRLHGAHRRTRQTQAFSPSAVQSALGDHSVPVDVQGHQPQGLRGPEKMGEQGGQRSCSTERRAVSADDERGRPERRHRRSQGPGQGNGVGGQLGAADTLNLAESARPPRVRSSHPGQARAGGARRRRPPWPGARPPPFPEARRPPPPADRPTTARPAGHVRGRRHRRPSGRGGGDRRAPHP